MKREPSDDLQPPGDAPADTLPAKAAPTAQQMYEEVAQALKQFGAYIFSDKGARELMGVSELAARLRLAPAAEAAQMLRGLAHSGPDDGFWRACSTGAARAIVLDLLDWDELFGQPGIDDLLNGDMPKLRPGDSPAGQVAPAKAPRRARPR